MRYFVLMFMALAQLLFINCTHAQDIHFSHIHASPTHINPAMNGVISGGDLRFIINAKEQWNTITNAYKTVNFSTDMKLFSLGRTTVLGAGVNFFADRAGDLGYKTTNINGSLSIIKALDQDNNLISIGFQGGWLTQSFDYTKMIGFDDEDAVEGLLNNNLSNFDLSAGLAWYYSYSWNSSFYLGASASHLNNTDVSFFNRSNIGNSSAIKLYSKYILHGGGNFRISKLHLAIIPSAIFVKQGPHQEINIGAFVKYKRKLSYQGEDFGLYLGSWLRWHTQKDLTGIDALQASFRVDIQKTALTFSYDFNISTLAKASRGLGSAEISIIQIIDLNGPIGKNNTIMCPAF